MQLSDFDYQLPDERIARYPLPTRSASRLLCMNAHGKITDTQFARLPDLLQAGDLLVLNDTKVIKARLFGQKQTGGKIELLVERIISQTDLDQTVTLHPNDAYPHWALCHIKASKAPKPGTLLWIMDVAVWVLGRLDNLFVVGFKLPVLDVLQAHGQLPIPPYFARSADQTDDTRYQTVFCNPQKSASVAAPTASLHFDQTLLHALQNKGIQTAFVTLHVGAGTFAPVKTETIHQHKMHKEYAHLPQETADKILQTQKNGNKIIAVGTTVTRVLESAYLHQVKSGKQKQLSQWQGDTDIFIYPPFVFGVIDRLITNFHLPKSTLLMLVSAFAGIQPIQHAYQHAIANHYRFFSYGDAMLLDKATQ